MKRHLIATISGLFWAIPFLILIQCSENTISPITSISSSVDLSNFSSESLSSLDKKSSFDKYESSSFQNILSSVSDPHSSNVNISSSDEPYSSMSSSTAETENNISFSVTRGFISEPFNLELYSNLEGEIYFTLLGTEPTSNNGTLYTQPISIDSTIIVKAALFAEGARTSDIIAHSYLFPLQVLNQSDDIILPHTAWGHDGPDWDMDSDVISAITLGTGPTEILGDIPTLSLSMDWDSWFGTSGIYIAGEGIEKVVTVEYIEPDGSSYQSRSAVEIFGGSSVNRWKTDKLSMKLTFRDEHGDGKFDYPLFDDSPVERFDRVILDAVLNLSFLHPDHNQRKKALYIQDQFIADLHNALGGYSPHGSYAHLYLNGIYWGMYYIHERPDHSFAESYFGGDKDSYDVIKHTATTIVKGNTIAFANLQSLVQKDLSIDSNYTAVTAVLEIDDYIAYMLINIWAGNTDWNRHNWYATKSPTTKWRFHSWDAEHVLKDLNQNVTAQLSTGDIGFLSQLLLNKDFKDRVQAFVDREFNAGGILSSENASAIFTKRIDEISIAIIAESARWGDNQSPGSPYTKENTWDIQMDYLLTTYFPQRSAVVLEQLKTAGIIQ